MKGKTANLELWMWRVLPILSLFAVRFFNHYKGGIMGRMWLTDTLLVVGWVIGWLLADSDHLFYAGLSNPHELSSQRVKQEFDNKNYKKMWSVLKDTEMDRTKLPIRNVLTAFVLTGVGLWTITSSTSVIAAGICFGFSVRLFSEIIRDENYKNWYWLFSREFTLQEHKGLLTAWGLVLIWQWSVLLRG